MTIEIRDITKTYLTGEFSLHVLKGITFTIDDGEMVAIMGPSGSGKSTLMNVIGLLDTPSTGSTGLMARMSRSWTRRNWRGCATTRLASYSRAIT